MPTVVLSSYNVVSYLEGGGHFWVYLQYVLGLRRIGCEVYWLERFQSKGDRDRDAVALSTFAERMRSFGLDGNVILYSGIDGTREYLGIAKSEAEAIFRRADLLLNFHYAIDPALLACFKRTALVDIDPGLLQFWMSTGQLPVPNHDVYFTIGETVGTPAATFPDCGLNWVHIRPPVCLELWPPAYDPSCERFTTVAGWWSGKWVKELDGGKEVMRENTKRIGFLEFVDLPRATSQPLELALNMAVGDVEEQDFLASRGWHIRPAREVASTPQLYRSYIQSSRGEFSCAKPSTIRSQNAWISDRTVCYLASGKPVVVQDTGPSSFLPNGLGMFRFSTVDQAADALEAVNADYARHCRAARELAEAYFDSREILGKILSAASA